MGKTRKNRTSFRGILLLALPLWLTACGGALTGEGVEDLDWNDEVPGIQDSTDDQYRPVALPPVVEDPSVFITAKLIVARDGRGLVVGIASDSEGVPFTSGTVGFVHLRNSSMAALALETAPGGVALETGVVPIREEGHFVVVTKQAVLSADTIYLVATQKLATQFSDIVTSESTIVSLSTTSPKVDQLPEIDDEFSNDTSTEESTETEETDPLTESGPDPSTDSGQDTGESDPNQPDPSTDSGQGSGGDQEVSPEVTPLERGSDPSTGTSTDSRRSVDSPEGETTEPAMVREPTRTTEPAPTRTGGVTTEEAGATRRTMDGTTREPARGDSTETPNSFTLPASENLPPSGTSTSEGSRTRSR